MIPFRRWVGPSVQAVGLACLAAGPLRAQETGSLCCERFDYLLEKTIFKVDAVRVEIAFTDRTPERVADLLTRDVVPSELPDSIAACYLGATGAAIRFTFERSFGLERFLRANRDVLKRLVEAGILSDGEYRNIDADNVERFQVLAADGIGDGDRLEHRIDGERVTTRYVDREGEVRIDESRVGDEQRRALLGSLFGPGSDFRNGLIELVLRRAALESPAP